MHETLSVSNVIVAKLHSVASMSVALEVLLALSLSGYILLRVGTKHSGYVHLHMFDGSVRTIQLDEGVMVLECRVLPVPIQHVAVLLLIRKYVGRHIAIVLHLVVHLTLSAK